MSVTWSGVRGSRTFSRDSASHCRAASYSSRASPTTWRNRSRPCGVEIVPSSGSSVKTIARMAESSRSAAIGR